MKPSFPINISSATVLLSVVIFIIPIFAIVFSALFGWSTLWEHLWQTVLMEYLTHSFWLTLGVSIGVLAMGVPMAWFTSVFDFPGRRYLSWVLLLPLAMPAYIIAYTYTGIFDFAGPVQTSLRDLTGWRYGDYWFFNIRSLGGAVVMLTLVLYPYVYLLARTAFLDQSCSLLEVGRSLGCSRWQGFWRISLPIARPAIVAGLMLALMETLADYGTVQYFGVSTFTIGIFRAFYGFGDSGAAAQLAAMLLSFVILLVILERHSRRHIRYYGTQSKKVQRVKLKSWKAYLVTFLCVLPVACGFFIPVLQLLWWSLTDAMVDWSFVKLAWNSFVLAFMAATVAVFFALIFAYTRRIHSRSWLINNAVSLSSMGYALPGTVIAIGVIIPFAWLDHQIIDQVAFWFNQDIGLLLSGTLFALIFAYTVRFLAVSLGAIESGLQKVKPNLDNAAKLMGSSNFVVVSQIHVPLLKTSVLTAFLIVFVDVLKELPATLVLRPFDFNTLAVRAYELAADERLIDAAPASLLIVVVGLIPVLLLNRAITQDRT